MGRHRLEVADVVRSAGTTFLAQHPTSGEQRKALRDIASCRTATLGGHVLACQQCDHQEISYNSCRNRHCPKCQGSCQAKWLQDRAADLLPVPYFHVVFTLPALLGPIALQNPRQIYGILFRAVSQTLLTIARDQRHLGAKIGFLAILHTWGQNLMHHPHLHCVVPGGGLGADESSWVSCHHSFFLPVRVLSRVFRGKFLHSLDRHYHTGELSFHGQLQSLACPEHWKTLLRQLRATDWVVYSKPPFGGPEQVLKYLARYTHRVAISNRRLLSFQQGQVSLRCKDYRRGGRSRTLVLQQQEFIRRFLLHALPTRFVRIRSYGFLANRCRRQKLALCRRLLAPIHTRHPQPETSLSCADTPPLEQPHLLCPVCGQGPMLRVDTLLPTPYRIEERIHSP